MHAIMIAIHGVLWPTSISLLGYRLDEPGRKGKLEDDGPRVGGTSLWMWGLTITKIGIDSASYCYKNDVVG
ncbi:hypothetical protein [Pasteuria penetrans]|uniref:hypothetical protein n=1 Tax=Pasteuria penetrans TaxID=86005 RepID=UPI000FB231B8|nr:hypothetical protein [Pasteuria penetrans]